MSSYQIDVESLLIDDIESSRRTYLDRDLGIVTSVIARAMFELVEDGQASHPSSKSPIMEYKANTDEHTVRVLTGEAPIYL